MLVPPSRAMPLANETRVRVEGRSKSSATTGRRAAAASPPARSAFSRSARSRIAATASGGWWRSVSSERPASEGMRGEGVGRTTVSRVSSRPRMPSERAEYGRPRQRPRESRISSGAVIDAEGGARTPPPPVGGPCSSRSPIAVPVGPGARRRHVGVDPLALPLAPRAAARRRARHGRGRCVRRRCMAALASGPSGHRRRGDGGRHRGVPRRRGWRWAPVTGPRSGGRAHREPVARRPADRRPQLRLLRRCAPARVPARRALRAAAVAGPARPRPLQGVQRPPRPRRRQPPAGGGRRGDPRQTRAHRTSPRASGARSSP